MERKEAKTDDIYLTREQVNQVLEGLNLLMKDHYYVREDDLPEDIIEIVNEFVQARSKFKYCANCRDYFYQRWSQGECGQCPTIEEEEE